LFATQLIKFYIMKNILLLGFSMLLVLMSCGPKPPIPLTGEVNLISEVKFKTIELRSIGYGDNKQKAINDAETKAFEILFFRGIPKSSAENALIGPNEAALQAKHKSYFEPFFGSRYRSFITSSYQSSPPVSKKGITSVVYDVTINVASLKKDLEENGIIRKFGF